VMVTLAAFCWSHGIDLDEAARTELARIWTKIDAIRAKQAAKPTGSALPIAVQPDAEQFYFCLPCTWSSSDVDCCTYPADEIYVDHTSTGFVPIAQKSIAVAPGICRNCPIFSR
ncbi:MAG: hypothetical protein PGN20_15465, partial [Agrobacterium cavarae]